MKFILISTFLIIFGMSSLEGASLAVAGGSTLKILFLTFSFIHLII